jgi:hypothetical protein
MPGWCCRSPGTVSLEMNDQTGFDTNLNLSAIHVAPTSLTIVDRSTYNGLSYLYRSIHDVAEVVVRYAACSNLIARV